MTKKEILWVILIFGLLSLKTVSGQNAKDVFLAGTPFISYYGPADYHAHNQNFDLCFDDRDFLYLANFAGPIEYDGNSWQLYETDAGMRATAIAYAHDQGVFVGGIGEAGIIIRNEFGAEYQSLNLFSDNSEANNEVIQIFVSGDKTYYITKNTVFTIENRELTDKFIIEGTISKAFLANGNIYLSINQEGLFVLENGKTDRIIPTDLLPAATTYSFFNVYRDGYILGTSRQGLWLFDKGGKCRPLAKTLNDQLKRYVISDGLITSSGELVLGTLRNGLLFIDLNKGVITNKLTRQKGLGDNGVVKIIEDKVLLWCVLDNGICSVNISSPFRYLAEGSGLEGIVNKITKYQGEYYAATYQGLFRFDTILKSFIPVKDINMACWDMVEHGGHLYVATSTGLLNIEQGNIIKENGYFSLSVAIYGDKVLLLGTENGLLTYSIINNKLSAIELQYSDNEEIADIICGISNIVITKSTSDNISIFKILDNNTLTPISNPSGIPNTAGIKAFIFEGKYYISTPQGVYKYDIESNSFQLYQLSVQSDSAWLSDFWISSIYNSTPDTIWIVAGDQTHAQYIVRHDSIWKEYPNRFVAIDNKIIKTVYAESGITFLGGVNEIIIHTSETVNEGNRQKCYIRKCILSNDSLIFNGGNLSPDHNPYELRAHQSDVKIYYSTPLFTREQDVLYSTFLEGRDEYPTAFTSQVFTTYSNLPKGQYTFHVKSKDSSGVISDEAMISFRIIPEWYNTLAFYIALVVAGIFLVYLFVKWRARQLQREKDNLEAIVKKRTKEISLQKNEISAQSKLLSEKNSELERINILVQSINTEVRFKSLLQALLAKMAMIQGAEAAMAFVKDDAGDVYHLNASFGLDSNENDSVISFCPVEKALLDGATEIGKDIFVAKTGIKKSVDGLPHFKSAITIIIKNQNTIDGILVLGSLSNENAFPQKDLDFIVHAQEHIISAFIKTRILFNLESTLDDLQNTQQELIRQEKLASVGQLTKGIVDRVINPLNYIINFANLSGELNEELVESSNDAREQLDPDFYEDLEEITSMLKMNLDKIAEHGNSASRIIKGMERLLKDRTGEKSIVNSNQIIEQQINLITRKYKGIDENFAPEVVLDFSTATEKAYIIDEYFAEAIQNIIDNAFDNMLSLKQANENFKPRLEIKTSETAHGHCYIIRDNGSGIPESELPRIFNPFYTTKPTSKGSGVGLYITNEIIENFNGSVTASSKTGEFTEFQIIIPHQLA